MTEMHNFMETLVLEYIPRYLKGVEGACDCERCRYDIAALALNQLPPKYVVANKGELYVEVSDLMRQYEADITMAIMRALEQVQKQPRHSGRLINPRETD